MRVLPVSVQAVRTNVTADIFVPDNFSCICARLVTNHPALKPPKSVTANKFRSLPHFLEPDERDERDGRHFCARSGGVLTYLCPIWRHRADEVWTRVSRRSEEGEQASGRGGRHAAACSELSTFARLPLPAPQQPPDQRPGARPSLSRHARRPTRRSVGACRRPRVGHSGNRSAR